ncbi:MocE family 2Fe-2S type ferredoxin [Stagnihabitans tardus]|uniref:Rieske 2Fe-2S domain-containing protein n=1 Tax=Stagnihabitans tardus TaxID=2699202 RepID=A0AAE4YC25_9RHOB|nr:MocE family 2Fe-2S type ferredoxin [Stagnihabitans tardus]NBZ87175.1 Rieske 2Fe-2S domain-containing protein [Stagnihabitans tardus]
MWVTACALDDIDTEDLVRWDHDGRTFAIYRDTKGAVFATDGLCTHENVHLCDGLVIGDQVECPKHNGRFDYKTGEAKRLPCTARLKTWATRVVDGNVEIDL